MLVDIKSDATGNDVYRGEITSIAPTSNKNTGGISSAASDVEFTAEVKITSVETNLKIGMNARLSIILDKKENVYSVPVDAVSTNQNGENVIYAVESAGKERYSARQIRVTTGMETDFYLEISGDDLSDGLQIILDSSEITSGQEITLK
jgi:multidrug efflux pump subunit AcrA (membrane-fusion protein)